MYIFPLAVFSITTAITLLLAIDDIIKHSKPIEKILFIEFLIMTGISITIAYTVGSTDNRWINYGTLLIQIIVVLTTIIVYAKKHIKE